MTSRQWRNIRGEAYFDWPTDARVSERETKNQIELGKCDILLVSGVRCYISTLTVRCVLVSSNDHASLAELKSKPGFCNKIVIKITRKKSTSRFGSGVRSKSQRFGKTDAIEILDIRRRGEKNLKRHVKSHATSYHTRTLMQSSHWLFTT